MSDLLTLLKESSKLLIILTIGGFLLGKYLEKSFDHHLENMGNKVKTSLSIKENLRNSEQKELVDFRVAVEKWEYFLQTGVADLTMASESKNFEPADFYRQDKKLFGDVRLAAVKASIYLRDQNLELELLKTISAIRNLYYPIVAKTIPLILDLQSEMQPYLLRMRQFEESGLKDKNVALNEAEAKKVIALRHQITDALNAFSTDLLANYKQIAEQLYILKEKINVHIYRPLNSTEINKETE